MSKRIDLTDDEFAIACKCMDIAVRATGLEFLQPIAALDRKLAQAQDVPDEPKPEES
jgi:hypothetical protein